MNRTKVIIIILVVLFVGATFAPVAVAEEKAEGPYVGFNKSLKEDITTSHSIYAGGTGKTTITSTPDENEILTINLTSEAIATSKRALSFIAESRGGFNDMFKSECRETLSVLKHEATKNKREGDKLMVELSRKHIGTIESALYFILGGKDAQDATNEIRLQIAILDGKKYWMKIVDADIGPGYHSVGTDMVRTGGEDLEKMKRRKEILKGIAERLKKEQRE